MLILVSVWREFLRPRQRYVSGDLFRSKRELLSERVSIFDKKLKLLDLSSWFLEVKIFLASLLIAEQLVFGSACLGSVCRHCSIFFGGGT